MNTEEIFDNLLDTSVDGDVFLEDLIGESSTNVLEQAIKENMMEVWESSPDYDLLSPPLDGDFKMDDINQSSNYLEWINWDQKLMEKSDENIIPASNSSDSGLSSDYQYEQQLSPVRENDCATPTNLQLTTAESVCSSVDVDNISSPDTICPSSPCSDGNLIDDPVDVEISHSANSTASARQATTSNPLVFPVSLKDLNLREIKAVKIIRNGSTIVSNAASAVLGGIKSSTTNVPDAIKKLLSPVQLSVPQQSTHQTIQQTSNKTSYPPIVLSDEERRLLAKEGVELPTHYPLTKHEERELKRIRRKIRNKISAQDSRKRKRVYMDGLEDRVKKCSDENMNLQKRIRLLETENKSLLSQLKRLQSLLTGQNASTPPTLPPATNATGTTVQNGKETPATTNNTTQPATCLLVLMLSFALFLLPNLKPDSSKSLTDGRSSSSASMSQTIMKMPPFGGRSRTLLQDTLALENDSEISDMELLEMALGGEVVVGDEEDEEGKLFVPLPLGPIAAQGGKSEVFKNSWGQKFGKQYPANPKRTAHAFLSEHDYHSTDINAKRHRMRDSWDEAVDAYPNGLGSPTFPAGKEFNQSQILDELTEIPRGQNIVVRISEEL